MARTGCYAHRSLPTLNERFTAKTAAVASGCIEWQGSLNWQGYGTFGIGERKIVKAHRYAYERAKGRIPSGMVIDHKCRNKKCVNPDHLEPVTPKENVLRGNASRPQQTHCLRGHEFTNSNTYIHPKRGTRHCKACQATRSKQ